MERELVLDGQKLRTKRVAAGLTQAQLAVAADLTPTYISRLEKVSTNLRLKTLGDLANAIGVDPEGILSWRSQKRTPRARRPRE